MTFIDHIIAFVDLRLELAAARYRSSCPWDDESCADFLLAYGFPGLLDGRSLEERAMDLRMDHRMIWISCAFRHMAIEARGAL